MKSTKVARRAAVSALGAAALALPLLSLAPGAAQAADPIRSGSA